MWPKSLKWYFVSCDCVTIRRVFLHDWRVLLPHKWCLQGTLQSLQPQMPSAAIPLMKLEIFYENKSIIWVNVIIVRYIFSIYLHTLLSLCMYAIRLYCYTYIQLYYFYLCILHLFYFILLSPRSPLTLPQNHGRGSWYFQCFEIRINSIGWVLVYYMIIMRD